MARVSSGGRVLVLSTMAMKQYGTRKPGVVDNAPCDIHMFAGRVVAPAVAAVARGVTRKTFTLSAMSPSRA